MAATTTRDELHRIADRLRSLREEKARGIKLAQAAKDAYEKSDSEDSALQDAAEQGYATVGEINAQSRRSPRSRPRLCNDLETASGESPGSPLR